MECCELLCIRCGLLWIVVNCCALSRQVRIDFFSNKIARNIIIKFINIKEQIFDLFYRTYSTEYLVHLTYFLNYNQPEILNQKTNQNILNKTNFMFVIYFQSHILLDLCRAVEMTDFYNSFLVSHELPEYLDIIFKVAGYNSEKLLVLLFKKEIQAIKEILTTSGNAFI